MLAAAVPAVSDATAGRRALSRARAAGVSRGRMFQTDTQGDHQRSSRRAAGVSRGRFFQTDT